VPTVDIRTLFLCLTLVDVFLSLVMWAYWKTQKTYPGFGLWVGCNLTIAVIYILFFLRGAIPIFFSIVVANTLIALAAALRLEGVKRFLGAKRAAYRNFLLLPALFVALYLYTYNMDSVLMRTLLGSAVIVWVDVAIAWRLTARVERSTRPAYTMIAVLFVLHALLVLYRSVVWMVDPTVRSLLTSNTPNELYFLFNVLFDIGWTVAFLTMNSRRLTEELESAQAGVEESRRRLADTIDFLPDATFAVDRAGRIVAWNRAIEALTGVPAGDMLGKGDYEYALPFYGERRSVLIDLALDPAAAAGVRYDGLEQDNRTLTAEIGLDLPRTGPAVLWARAAPLVDGQGVTVGAIESVRDVTERKRVELELRQLNQELDRRVRERTLELEQAYRELQAAQERMVRTEKLAALGQLAGSVSHELRNPLGAIKNAAYYLDLALEHPAPDVREMLDLLEREVGAMDRIIGSLLDYARSRPPVPGAVRLNELVAESLGRVAIPESVTVVREMEPDLPAILADGGQLGQVFTNLIQNAVQAMPQGGRLRVTTASERDGRTGRVAVSIADTGVGIPAENLVKLFEPLFSTRAGGIGLGLAIAKGLVEGNGGTVEINSEVGRGSTFTVRVPLPKGV
jgi:signal transduction histidine kinase